MNFEALAAEFPREAISWRAQSVTKAGDKAMALAYIDARDVMRRLDEVCGPANWEDSYTETARGRVIGTIRILVDGQWVSKSDGAGDTAVEGEKGGISDAFKRAAVKWGIGRYLYDLDAPWVPCEVYEANGKKHWRKWSASPWDYIDKGTPGTTKAKGRETYDRLSKANAALTDEAKFNKFWSQSDVLTAFENLPRDWRQTMADEKADKAAELAERAAMAADDTVPPNFENLQAAE